MREIRKLYCFTFFRSLIFYASISVAFYTSNGLSYFQIMLLQSIYGITTFLFEIPSGILSDIIGRKKTLLIGTILFAFAYCCGVLGKTFMPFVAMQILAAGGQSCYSGTFVSLMYEDVKNDNSINKNVNIIFANMQSINIFAVLLSALMCSVIVNYQGMRLTYFYTVIAYIITLMIGLFLADSVNKNDTSNSERVFKYGKQLKNSWKNISENGIEFVIIDLLIFAIFFGTFSYMQQTILIINGLKTEMLGLITFILTCGTLLVLKMISRYEKQFNNEKYMRIFTFFSIFFVISDAFVKSFIWNVFTFLFLTITARYKEIFLTNNINKYLNDDTRATIMSVISAIQMIGLAMFCLIIGKIEDISVYYAILALGVIIFVLYGILFGVVKCRKNGDYSEKNN